MVKGALADGLAAANCRFHLSSNLEITDGRLEHKACHHRNRRGQSDRQRQPRPAHPHLGLRTGGLIRSHPRQASKPALPRGDGELSRARCVARKTGPTHFLRSAGARAGRTAHGARRGGARTAEKARRGPPARGRRAPTPPVRADAGPGPRRSCSPPASSPGTRLSLSWFCCRPSDLPNVVPSIGTGKEAPARRKPPPPDPPSVRGLKGGHQENAAVSRLFRVHTQRLRMATPARRPVRLRTPTRPRGPFPR